MANPHPKPNPATQFKPGQSGNPGGRPAGVRERIRLEIGEDGDLALRVPLAILRDWKRQGKARGKVTRELQWAVEQLLDRGFGKPTQPMEHEVRRRRTTFEFSGPEEPPAAPAP